MTAGQTEAKELLAQAVDHHKAGRLADAEELYKRVLHVDPAVADAWYLLGAMADEAGKSETALQYLDEALQLAPGNGQFHYSRGLALQNLNQLEAAAGAYRDTLRYNPGHVQAQENLAVALLDSGDADQAETLFREVLKVVPDSAIARSNLGTLLINKGQRESALEHIEHLLALNPADASARSKRYQILLALGRFRDGYADYAWRHHSPDFNAGSPPQLMALPSLGNRDVDDRKLVILPEQGVGDEVLFAAGLPAVLAKAHSVVLFADPRLQTLLQRSFPTLDVRPTEPANRCSWPTGIDATWLRLEAGDLPGIAFGDAFPTQAAYLRADPQRVRYWQDRLADLPGQHIGIAWRGGVDSRAQQARSLSLAELAPLMDALDASFINLQYAAPGHGLSAEIQAFNATRAQQPGIIELDGLDTRDDLDEMAALTLALDCVVTIDQAIAHLAAAVGARTCVLVPPGGDWRWFDARDDSAWYIHARVWRPSPGAGWDDAISALSDWLSKIDTSSTAAPPISAAPAEALAVVTTNEAAAPASNGTTLLLNDTSAWYHWGCSCTSIALNEGLRSTQATVNSCALLQDLKTDALPVSVDAFSSAALFRRFRRRYGWLVDAIEAADRIVINGEGTLHGTGPQAVGLLYLASIAANRFARPVQLVNHSVYPLDGHTADEKLAVAMYRTVYDSLENVVVREPASKAVMDALGLPSTLGFDCLPIFAASHGPELRRDGGPSKHIVIAGSVHLTAARLALFEELINDLSKDGYRISLLLGARGYPALDDAQFAAAILTAGNGKLDVVLASSEFEWLQHIRDADLLVSGRFHHSIAAACMRTPFIVLGSNTPKIEGLMQILAEQSSHEENFQITAANSGAMTAAIRNRLEAPAEFVLQDAAIQRLRELASLNFSLA